MGGQVTVLPAAVSHGSLTVSITENAQVSQPNDIRSRQHRRHAAVDRRDPARTAAACSCSPAARSLESIVRAVNAVGAAPGDIVAILEALKRAGALRAELEVI